MAIFVVAHGAWSAGWVWKKMRPLLREQGHELFTPTYTGLESVCISPAEAGYDERIRKTFPFYETVHTTINAVLRVYLGPESEILIVCAGTGAEILELGKTNPGWHFLGVDPAQPMLDLAKGKIEAVGLADRVSLFHGFVGDLPTRMMVEK